MDRRPLLFISGFSLMFFTLPSLAIKGNNLVYVFALGFFLGVPPVLSWISHILDLIEERKILNADSETVANS